MEVLGTYAHQASQGNGFQWTSITVNTGFASARHRDVGNAGPSLIQAFGDFQGGDLLVWEDDPKNKTIKQHNDNETSRFNAKKLRSSTVGNYMLQRLSQVNGRRLYGIQIDI